MKETVVISKSKLRSCDIYEQLRFLYNVDKERFCQIFNFWDFSSAKTNEDVDNELKAIADLAISGKDKTGGLKDLKDVPFVFDTQKMILEVRPRHNMVCQSNISMAA